jgi:hypothetical protein
VAKKKKRFFNVDQRSNALKGIRYQCSKTFLSAEIPAK